MLINLRNALMAGKRLPYDAEVEYLESTGTQWIDTRVSADSNLSVEITMANAGTPFANVNPCGAVLITPQCRHHINFHRDGIAYYFGKGDSCVLFSHYMPPDAEIFTLKVDAINKTFKLRRFISTFPNDTFDTGLSYWLFGRNGTTPPYLGSLRIYSAKLWDGNTLVRDYIPVRKGTVGYMYDRVSGKLFGNAGTGEFVVGQDVMPVEWLQTDGSAYINTELFTSSATDYDIRFSVSSFATGSFVYGAWNDSSHRQDLFIQNNRLAYASNGGASVPMGALAVDTVIDASLRSGVLTIYGTSRTFTDSTALRIPFYLLATNRVENTTAAISGTRLYFCRLWNNSVLERNLLPVRVGTEGAMMDVLTRRIYRNAGTGAFIYGNDLKYPIPA